MILRLMKRVAPGPRPEGARRRDPLAHRRGARLRARGRQPAHARADLPRPPVHRRPRRRHAAVARAGRRRRSSSRGRGFEEIKQLAAGRARPHRRDRSSASTSAACTATTSSAATRTRATRLLLDDGRMAFLDFGLFKRIPARGRRVRARDPAPRRSRAAATSCIEHLHQRRLHRRARRYYAEEKILAQFHDLTWWYTHDEEIQLDARDRHRGDDPDERSALAHFGQDAPRDAAARPPLRPAPGDADARRHQPAAGQGQLAPDRARVDLRRRAGHRARPPGGRVLRAASA